MSHYPKSDQPQTSRLQRGRTSYVRRPVRYINPPHRQPQTPRYVTQHALQPFVEQTIRLLTNAYSLKLYSEPTKTVYEYEVKATTTSACNHIPVKVLRKNFVSRSIRKLVMDTIIPRIANVTTDVSKNGAIVLESNLDSIFSLIPFHHIDEPFKELKSGEELVFKDILVETDLLARLRLDIVIKHSRSTPMSSIEQTSTFLTSVLHHNLFLNMLRYGSVYYISHELFPNQPPAPTKRLDLISTHIMGISISGIKRTVNGDNLVVINCSHSYITQAFRLIDLLAMFISNQPVQNVVLDHSINQPLCLVQRSPEIANIVGNENWFLEFCSLLSGFKCRAFGPNETNIRFAMTDQSAADLLIDVLEEESCMSVSSYYQKMGINLNYPNLPCLRSSSTKHAYYPFEMCSLMAGQKVPVFRLSSAAAFDLASLNKPSPIVSKRSSLYARNEIVKINNNEFENYGLRMSANPVETCGSLLQKPTLEYRSKCLEPCRDYWESGSFYNSTQLVENWCVVVTAHIDTRRATKFFSDFALYSRRFGFVMEDPYFISKPKDAILNRTNGIESVIDECRRITKSSLRLVLFLIDSASTSLNRSIHLYFDEHTEVATTCLRVESILNTRQEKSIFRTLIHKLNTRLGGTNVIYHNHTLEKLCLRSEDLMVVGLDVTHPDNELSGVSIVGCAYTYNSDLFRHRSLVWPQTARVEIITKVDALIRRLMQDYRIENNGRLPKQMIVYRDGVSHEEFERVRKNEVSKAKSVLAEFAEETGQDEPTLSYIIAQKRHTMRFFHMINNEPSNPPSGTLIDQDVISHGGREFFLYSNTSPQATARPLHYHIILNGLGVENLQKLTYFLCFNFGKCSGTLSMPSSLRYAHNAAYDARNRVIAAREFSENRFYSSRFYC